MGEVVSNEKMSLMQEHTRVMGILRRKVVHGQDCTEDESAILKNFVRLDIRNPLTHELENEIRQHFFTEYSEGMHEAEMGWIDWRGDYEYIDLTDRRQTAEFEKNHPA